MTRLLLFCGLLISFATSGQRPSHTDFFNAAGSRVESADSAYYYVTWDFRKKPGIIVSHYLQPVSIRFKSSAVEDSGDHLRTYYYPNGKMKAISKFNGDWPIGQVKAFYPNGSLQSDLEFQDGKLTTDQKSPRLKIINYWDSLGNQIVKDGSGRCDCNMDPFADVPEIESGEVHGSMQEGTWVGASPNGKLTFREIYHGGILISGISACDGENFEYVERKISAKPKNEMIGFYKQLGERMEYPRNARRFGIEGIVYVEFVILEDGSLADVKVVAGFDQECDAAAIRAVKSSPKWEPGREMGRKVKQRYTLPIIFKLG
jgi:TonB family protein